MLRPQTLFALLALAAVSCGGSTETSPVSSGTGGAAGTGGTGGVAGTGGIAGTGGSGLGGMGGVDPVPDAGPDAPPSTLEGQAFNIIMPMSDAGQWCEGDCIPATLLITKATDTAMEAVWGSTGRAANLSLARTAGYWALSGTLLLGKERTWSHAMCDNETNLGPAKFIFQDMDSNGKLDLFIDGHQESKICSDDYTTGSESDVTLLGQGDTRTPIAEGPGAEFEPSHGLGIILDKPMEKAAGAELVPSAGGDPIVLTPEEMNGYVIGFKTTRVLPLGSTYTTKFSGKDFAGFGTPADLTLQTLGDFGLLAQDGFESGATSGISGASVVESYGVPALAGQRMLQVPAGAVALLHLQRAADEKTLTMDVRKYVACWGMQFDGSFQLEAAVVGASGTHAGVVTLGANSSQVEVNGTKIVVGELQKVTIDLPEAGKDVLVYMKGDDYMGAGCSMVGVLLDEVRLQ